MHKDSCTLYRSWWKALIHKQKLIAVRDGSRHAIERGRGKLEHTRAFWRAVHCLCVHVLLYWKRYVKKQKVKKKHGEKRAREMCQVEPLSGFCCYSRFLADSEVKVCIYLRVCTQICGVATANIFYYTCNFLLVVISPLLWKVNTICLHITVCHFGSEYISKCICSAFI